MDEHETFQPENWCSDLRIKPGNGKIATILLSFAGFEMPFFSLGEKRNYIRTVSGGDLAKRRWFFDYPPIDGHGIFSADSVLVCEHEQQQI